jgi:hypothetical protein
MKNDIDTPLLVRARSGWRFALVLLAALLALLALSRPYFGGDTVEYTLETVALADHGSGVYQLLEDDMRAGKQDVYAAFARGKGGDVYAIHFFGYPALAALPFKLFEMLGVPPFKAFQAVNYAAVFVLGLALLRFFGSPAQAACGVLLFLLCGGLPYLDWTSPECLSAAGLLSGLLFYLSGAPLAGAVLAGLAGQQNPTIVFFFAFAPLLKLYLDWRPGASLAVNAKAQLTRANLLGLAAGAAVFALPPLFNLAEFGVPNIIARKFSDPGLISGTRLVSFFFDLNQGMILGIPGVLAALLLWGWKRPQAAPRHAARLTGLLGLCLLFVLALILPALAVLNWNSGAAGVMRYAFWAAMPLLLALLLRLRGMARWPGGLLLWLALAQAGATLHGTTYSYVEFSPAAQFVLAHANRWYHPEPEIFAERMARNDDYIQPDKVYVSAEWHKALVNPGGAHVDELLCGPGKILAPETRMVESTRGWHYIDGPIACQTDSQRVQRYDTAQFENGAGIALVSGWSKLEHNGGAWDGVWSVGQRSKLLIAAVPGLRPSTLSLQGTYFEGNHRTRVWVNGTDLGWLSLDRLPRFALPADSAGKELVIELEHEAPRSPGAGDPRALAFFLRSAELREGKVPK